MTYICTGTYVDDGGTLHIHAADLLARAESPDTPGDRRRIGVGAIAILRDAGVAAPIIVHLSRRSLA